MTAGTYSWTCPEGVTSISVVAIGGGGGQSVRTYQSKQTYRYGEAGGAGWKNNYTVIPGQSYTVVVGNGGTNTHSTTSVYQAAGDGGDSYFIDNSTIAGYGGDGGDGGGGGAGEGIYVGDGGIDGENGTTTSYGRGYDVYNVATGTGSLGAGEGRNGAVRIVWPGSTKSFPIVPFEYPSYTTILFSRAELSSTAPYINNSDEDDDYIYYLVYESSNYYIRKFNKSTKTSIVSSPITANGITQPVMKKLNDNRIAIVYRYITVTYPSNKYDIVLRVYDSTDLSVISAGSKKFNRGCYYY